MGKAKYRKNMAWSGNKEFDTTKKESKTVIKEVKQLEQEMLKLKQHQKEENKEEKNLEMTMTHQYTVKQKNKQIL